MKIHKSVALISVIVGILVVAFVIQQLVYRYVDLRGSEPIEVHDEHENENDDHEHEPETPEEHEHADE